MFKTPEHCCEMTWIPKGNQISSFFHEFNLTSVWPDDTCYYSIVLQRAQIWQSFKGLQALSQVLLTQEIMEITTDAAGKS